MFPRNKKAKFEFLGAVSRNSVRLVGFLYICFYSLSLSLSFFFIMDWIMLMKS